MLLGDHVTLKPCCTDSGLNAIHRAKTTLKSGAKNVGMPLISGQEVAKLANICALANRALVSIIYCISAIYIQCTVQDLNLQPSD